MVDAALVDVSPACRALRRGLSSSGQHWASGWLATVEQNGSPIQFTVACALDSPTDDEHVTVVAPSSEDQALGQSVCVRFASKGGWQRAQTGTTTTLAPAGY
jgi:hypothetical protein